ncbi:MAG: glycosyltransferase family 9 protein [Candidatus Omnitrophica bacterium]|nr:glycosyltransferase family 9 protein [Candidatus Omnitrophota bacterium]MDD5610521.1 glycosyltransferase family 9 protein [Candidatus Omnitrophota bacterium]
MPFLSVRRTRGLEGEEIKTILFIRHDRIGDMVLSTPVFPALKRRFPSARIIVLASTRNKEIIASDPYVDEILLYNSLGLFRRSCSQRKIDLAIDPFCTYGLKTAFLAYLSGAKFRIGFEKAGREIFFNLKGPGLDGAGTILKHHEMLVRALGIETKDFTPRLYLSQEEISSARNAILSRGIKEGEFKIVVHPGGFYPSQRWGFERFSALCKEITQRLNAKIIFFTEDKELNISNVFNFSHLGLRQVMSIIGQAELFIGNNSGPLHIACALGIPTVSTMGPSDPMLWWPQGENNIVIRKDLPCSPCHRPACSVRDCMGLITVEEMFMAVEKQMEKLR